MSKRLYVGNLAFSVTEAELNDLFGQYGEIESCHLVIDRDSGRSKGFAFVEMTSEDEAQDAIEKLAEFELSGRKLNVNEARPKPQSGRWGSDSSSDRGSSYGNGGGNGYRGSY